MKLMMKIVIEVIYFSMNEKYLIIINKYYNNYIMFIQNN